MHTRHLGFHAMEMRIDYLTVVEVELSAKLIALLTLLLLNAVAVVPVSSCMVLL